MLKYRFLKMSKDLLRAQSSMLTGVLNCWKFVTNYKEAVKENVKVVLVN